MKIRAALTGEADILSALAFEAKAHWGYTDETMTSWLGQLRVSAADIASKPTYVCTINGDIVGFYSLAPSTEVWELEHLWVAPQFMNRGIGKSLLAHALEEAGRNGAASVTVDADPNAAAFYLSRGGIPCGAVAAPIAGDPNRIRPQLAFLKLAGRSSNVSERTRQS